MELEYESCEERPLTQKERRQNCEKKKKELENKGQKLFPIEVKPREKIAKKFWAKLWYENLSCYEDLDYRLPIGRHLVGSNAILHFYLEPLGIKALVFDGEVFETTIKLKLIEETQKEELSSLLKNQVSSLFDLLSGKIPEEIAILLSQKEKGLFPKLEDLHFECPCTDYANLCSHAAAALIGFSKLLDEEPRHLFTLRSLDPMDLLEKKSSTRKNQEKPLDSEKVSSLFDIDLLS